MKQSTFLYICGCIILLSAAGGYSLINKKLGIPDDNPVEEEIENIIEKETGLKIDLTPQSPEIKSGN